MQSIHRPTTEKPAIQPMKRFVIREAESIQTTRPSNYCACCCKGC